MVEEARPQTRVKAGSGTSRNHRQTAVITTTAGLKSHGSVSLLILVQWLTNVLQGLVKERRKKRKKKNRILTSSRKIIKNHMTTLREIRFSRKFFFRFFCFNGPLGASGSTPDGPEPPNPDLDPDRERFFENPDFSFFRLFKLKDPTIWVSMDSPGPA